MTQGLAMEVLLVGLRDYEGVETRRCMDALGWHVTSADNPQEVLSRQRERRWDAIVLDTWLPSGGALDLCQAIRRDARYTPVMLLSDRGEEVHRIVGLELGADGYLVKPVSVAEVLARIKAVARAAQHRRAKEGVGMLALPGLQMDLVARRAEVGGKPMRLTPREFDLLAELARHPGDVLSHRRLLGRIWNHASAADEHTLVSHVHRLRAKLETQHLSFIRIMTVWGCGYRLTVENPAA